MSNRREVVLYLPPGQVRWLIDYQIEHKLPNLVAAVEKVLRLGMKTVDKGEPSG